MIADQGRQFAIIIRDKEWDRGTNFVTENDALLQVGYLVHPASYKITPHRHLPYRRQSEGTHEVLIVKTGRVRIDFYHDDTTLFTSRELMTGDVAVLMNGGHGFEIMEPTVLIEVKTGPYAGDQDKIRFEGTRK